MIQDPSGIHRYLYMSYILKQVLKETSTNIYQSKSPDKGSHDILSWKPDKSDFRVLCQNEASVLLLGHEVRWRGRKSGSRAVPGARHTSPSVVAFETTEETDDHRYRKLILPKKSKKSRYQTFVM